MRPTKLLAAAAALSLLVTPIAAQAARPLSLANSPAAARAGAGMEDSAELGGRRGGMGWILAAVALGILIFVVMELNDENDLPNSP